IMLSVLFSVIARTAQPAIHQSAPALSMRAITAADSLAFYLIKVIWPENLCADYGRTPASIAAGTAPYFAWIIPVMLFAAAFAFHRRWPFGLAGICVFAAALIPVSGLVPFDFQEYSTVADRYTYLPLIGIAIAIAGLIAAAH